MSRNARVVVPEVPHHVTQRGIRKSDIFREDEDYRKYSDLIVDNSRKYGVLTRSYSWMPNHVHLIAIPLRPDSFAETFRRTHSTYARWFLDVLRNVHWHAQNVSSWSHAARRETAGGGLFCQAGSENAAIRVPIQSAQRQARSTSLSI
jgi:REP element-mobilizing transposase RayT